MAVSRLAVSRRRLLGCAGAAFLAGACAAPASNSGSTGRLRLLAQAVVPHRFAFRGTPVGGLSAIDFDPATGGYLLLSDDRSDFAPARFYRMRWDWPAGPQWTDLALLRQADGGTWPARREARAGVPVPDPEGLRLLPGGASLLWASEGDPARGFGPALYQAAPDGTLLREFALPPHFGVGDSRGTRDNLGFEGLALTVDGRHAWLAMEGPLRQDGPPPGFDAPGGPCRLTLIDLASGRPLRQIAYGLDPIPMRPLLPGGFADNGISEILMQDDRHMLVLERAFAAGAGNSLRLYRIDIEAASDTLTLDTLRPGNHRPAPKALLADFATLGLPRLDNSEGMCWGAPMPSGRRTLVVVSDDNFNPLQINQFIAFEFIE